MKSLLEGSAANEITERVGKLQEGALRNWGKMEVAQMVAHCSNALEMAMGIRNPKRIFIGRLIGPLFRKKYSDDSVFSKDSPTSEELRVTDQREFNKEKERLLGLVKKFLEGGEKLVTRQSHPFFGNLTPKEWAFGMYKHLDHHLRQFGG